MNGMETVFIKMSRRIITTLRLYLGLAIKNIPTGLG